MAENRRKAADSYVERFEFRLTIGSNIICQRYFKISDPDESALHSEDMLYLVSGCAEMIQEDLKLKTGAYLEAICPRIFKDEEEMDRHLADAYNRSRMILGEGIVVKNSDTPNYAWKGDGPGLGAVPLKATGSYQQSDNREILDPIREEDIKSYTLSFYDGGRLIAQATWDGMYPKYVRKAVDLSNRGVKVEKKRDVYSLPFDQYLRYKLADGHSDLVSKIIGRVGEVCSSPQGGSSDGRPRYKRSRKNWNQGKNNGEEKRVK